MSPVEDYRSISDGWKPEITPIPALQRPWTIWYTYLRETVVSISYKTRKPTNFKKREFTKENRMVRVLKTHLHYQMCIVINLDLYPIFIVLYRLLNSSIFTSMNFVNTFFIMIKATVVIIFIQIKQPLKNLPLL